MILLKISYNSFHFILSAKNLPVFFTKRWKSMIDITDLKALVMEKQDDRMPKIYD